MKNSSHRYKAMAQCTSCPQVRHNKGTTFFPTPQILLLLKILFFYLRYTDGSGVVGMYITIIPVIAKIATITPAQTNSSILFTDVTQRVKNILKSLMIVVCITQFGRQPPNSPPLEGAGGG
jgi:hypothetical protein